MEIVIGFLLAGFGGMILYSVITEKRKKKGSGNALIISIIMIILGGIWHTINTSVRKG